MLTPEQRTRLMAMWKALSRPRPLSEETKVAIQEALERNRATNEAYRKEWKRCEKLLNKAFKNNS